MTDANIFDGRANTPDVGVVIARAPLKVRNNNLSPNEEWTCSEYETFENTTPSFPISFISSSLNRAEKGHWSPAIYDVLRLRFSCGPQPCWHWPRDVCRNKCEMGWRWKLAKLSIKMLRPVYKTSFLIVVKRTVNFTDRLAHTECFLAGSLDDIKEISGIS